jgi:prolyl-tRNA synthetase
MAMPVIKGEKTAGERFPGAVSTYTIEAMMQDRKALQAGTSHFLGQNFSRVQEIKFQDQNGAEQFAWTTSWGVTTRLIGALTMTHSDDDGLVLPPRLAPKHVVLLPIYRNDDERSQVMPYVESLKRELEAQDYSGGKVRVLLDKRDLRGGEKSWYHVKRGVPLRAEVGPKDLAQNSAFVGRRDTGEKKGMPRTDLVAQIGTLLDSMQKNLFDRAIQLREANTKTIDSLDDFRAYFTPANEDQPEIHGGFARCHFAEDPRTDEMLKELKVTIRCVALGEPEEKGTCLFTGLPSTRRGIFAKAY